MASILPDVTSPASDNIVGPKLSWEPEFKTLSHLVDSDILPCVACYTPHNDVTKQGETPPSLSPGLRLYSSQPVLLHAKARSRQARTRTICRDDKGTFLEVGQTLIIPDDYKGWFEVVPSDFSRSNCLRSIEEVAKVMPLRFFTRSNLKAIRVEGQGEDQTYMERKIPAGSVLATKGRFTAKWKTQAVTGMWKKKTQEWQMEEVTYLACVEDGVEVLVPLSHRGKFNPIYAKGHGSVISQNAVYTMQDVLSDLDLPVKVRLLFGMAPVVPCIFTGMLVVRGVNTTDTVIGATVLNSRNVLFELPINAPVKIRLAKSIEPLEEMTSYKDGQKLCRKYANLFASMIKLSPELDTYQKVIMHVPSDPALIKQDDDALRDLDLITDISLHGTPESRLLDSDTSSQGSGQEASLVPRGGRMEGVHEYRSQTSHTHV